MYFPYKWIYSKHLLKTCFSLCFKHLHQQVSRVLMFFSSWSRSFWRNVKWQFDIKSKLNSLTFIADGRSHTVNRSQKSDISHGGQEKLENKICKIKLHAKNGCSRPTNFHGATKTHQVYTDKRRDETLDNRAPKSAGNNLHWLYDIGSPDQY